MILSKRLSSECNLCSCKVWRSKCSSKLSWSASQWAEAIRQANFCTFSKHILSFDRRGSQILYYTARSILPKMDHSVKLYHPNIIRVTESWLSKDISDGELSLPGYQLFRLNRDCHMMGESLLSFTITLHPLSPPSLELISLSLHFNKDK